MTGWRPRLLAAVVALVALVAVTIVVVNGGDDHEDADHVETADERTTTTGSTDTTAGTTSSSATSSTATTAGSNTTTTTTTTRPSSAPASASATTAPRPPATRSAPAPLSGVHLKLTSVASADYPIAMAVRPSDGSVWIARKAGFVCRLSGGTCSGSVKVADVSTGNEQGLLGLAFNPAGNRLYLSYTSPAGATRLDVRPTATSGGLGLGAVSNLFSQDQPEANHNGGNVVVGPDGYLYLGLGDGGGGGDQHGTTGNGQNPNTNLGKILRINPTTKAVQRWIEGVRNPWRFSFDKANGDLWVGDVGQDKYEEIDYLPAGTAAGKNLGWRCMEGTHVYRACSPQTPSGYVGPIFDYPHDPGCSVTGGYVYRGTRIASLKGVYLFADYCDGELRAIAHRGSRLVAQRRLGVNPGTVVSFGQDAAGELYVLTPSAILRIDAA